MEMTKHQVSVAAEAIVASLLAQAGCDVFVQYGANQPGYDLVASRNEKLRKVSVKGSKNGKWPLAVREMKKGSIDPNKFQRGVESWRKRQDDGLVFAFVSYGKVALGEKPRIYLASPDETAAHMKTQDNGKGGTSLWENWTKTKGRNKGFSNKIPVEWIFSEQRLGKFI